MIEPEFLSSLSVDVGEIVSMGQEPPDVMARLARREEVDPSSYVFRTVVRFETGAPNWRS